MNELANLEVSIEKVSDVERRLAIEIPWDQVKGRLDEAYQELSRGVALKGFRRGKVPRAMLERLFGKHVNTEVSQRLMQEGIAKVVVDNKIAAVSEPQLDDQTLTDGTAFKFSATLQIVPEITVENYSGIDVTQRPAKVSDEALDRALQSKQQELTDFQAVEGRNTTVGDVIMFDVMGKIGKEPVDYSNQMLELGAADSTIFPGLAQALTGISAAEKELELELEVPVHKHAHDEPCPGPDAEQKEKARLLVTIRDIKQKMTPALDDDFAKDTGEAETLEELKAVYRKRLLEEDEKMARREAQDRLIKEIAKRNHVPVAPALVEREIDRMLSFQAMLMGVDVKLFKTNQNVRDSIRSTAEEMVKRSLILDAVSRQEQVEVNDAELDQKLEEIASERGQNAAKIRADYEKKGRLDDLRAGMKEDKTLDLLMSKANITIAEISETETETSE